MLGFSGKAVVQASISNSDLDQVLILILNLGSVFNRSSIQGLWVWPEAAAVWIIRCSLEKDENSFVQELSFTLLDTHPK